MRLLVLQVDDANPFEAVLAFGHHRMAGEQVKVVNLHRRVVGDEFFPVRCAGVLHRGSGNAVVLGLVIGADVELAAPVGDEVFVVRLARLHQAQRRVGLARRQEPDLGAELALGGEEHKGPVPGAVHREVEQFVRLEIDPLR